MMNRSNHEDQTASSGGALRADVAKWSLAAAGLVSFAIQAWGCFCLFPLHAWNDVRLRPSFLIGDGLPLYPGINDGPITTWMYGPAHPIWFLPVTWLRDAGNVFTAAASWNIIGLILAVVAVCLAWPRNSRVSRSDTTIALATCLLLIPGQHLTFLQADNIVLICGLLSLTCLARHQSAGSSIMLWMAALLAATAAFAKAHGVAVIAGEWVGLTILIGRGAWPLIWRTLVACVAWGLVTLSLSSSPVAAWEHLVLLPSHLPWEDDTFQRTLGLKIELLLMVVLPAALLWVLAGRRQLGRLESIGAWMWICSIPLGLAGAYKTGGSNNSLHGVFFLMPLLVGLLHGRSFCGKRIVLVPITIIALNLISTWRTLSSQPLKPAQAHIQQAEYLADGLNESLWLPWRPLVTYLSTGRHDHDEDGLYVRQITGYFPSRRQISAHLPPRWRVTATEYPGMHWGISTAMLPEGTKSELIEGWLFYTIPDDTPANGELESTGHE